MEQGPGAYHRIFTLEFYVDLIFYGFLMGSISLVNFVIVLWGYYPVSSITSLKKNKNKMADFRIGKLRSFL